MENYQQEFKEFNNSSPSMDNPMETPDISLATSAILVEWNVSQWSGRRKDKRASAELAASKGAAQSSVSVNKSLIDCRQLKDIATHVGWVRNNYHYPNSLPWSDSGLRIVATSVLPEYTKKMDEHRQEFDRLVEEFLTHYQNTISTARINLGELFNEDEYPTVEELRPKFAFRVNYMPLPDTGDLRVDVAGELRNQMATSYNNFYHQQIEKMAQCVWSDLYDALKHMSERLDFDDCDKKKKIYETTITNLQHMVDLLGKYNFANDPEMSRMQRELTVALTGVTVEGLRSSEDYRAQKKKEIDAAISKLPSLDF